MSASLKTPTYLVAYKDSQEAPELIFGPFLSLNIAETFSKAIPHPLKGGHKTYRTLQRFTAQDTAFITDLIMVGRNQRKAA